MGNCTALHCANQLCQHPIATYVGDELHVLRRADVLSKVDLVEAVFGHVIRKAHLASREAARRLVGAVALVHLPREQALADRDHLVARRRLHLVVRAQEGEHGRVVAVHVVGVREALLDLPLDVVRIESDRWQLALRSEELAVAARHVAVAHDVAEDEHVLRLGDDRLGVAARQAGRMQTPL